MTKVWVDDLTGYQIERLQCNDTDYSYVAIDRAPLGVIYEWDGGIWIDSDHADRGIAQHNGQFWEYAPYPTLQAAERALFDGFKRNFTKGLGVAA